MEGGGGGGGGGFTKGATGFTFLQEIKLVPTANMINNEYCNIFFMILRLTPVFATAKTGVVKANV